MFLRIWEIRQQTKLSRGHLVQCQRMFNTLIVYEGNIRRAASEMLTALECKYRRGRYPLRFLNKAKLPKLKSRTVAGSGIRVEPGNSMLGL